MENGKKRRNAWSQKAQPYCRPWTVLLERRGYADLVWNVWYLVCGDDNGEASAGGEGIAVAV